MEDVSSSVERTNFSNHPKDLYINSNCTSSTVAIPTESPPSKLRRYLYSIQNYSMNVQYKTVNQNQVIPTAPLTSQEKGKSSCSHVSETESSVDGRLTGKQFCELYQLCPSVTSTPVSSKSSEIGIVKEVLVTANNTSTTEENQHNSECLNSSSHSIKKTEENRRNSQCLKSSSLSIKGTEENRRNSECLKSSSLSLKKTEKNQRNSGCLNSSSLSIKKQLILKKLDGILSRSDNERNQSIILDKLLKVFEEYDCEKADKNNDVAMEISSPIEPTQAKKAHSQAVETDLEVSALESIVDSSDNNIDSYENEVGPRLLTDTEIDGSGGNISQSGLSSKENSEASRVCIQENMSANTSHIKSHGKKKKSPAKYGKSINNSKGGIRKASTKKVKKRRSARLKDRPTQARLSNFDYMNAVYEDLRRKKPQGHRRRNTIDPAILDTKRRKLFSPDAWLSTLEACT